MRSNSGRLRRIVKSVFGQVIGNRISRRHGTSLSSRTIGHGKPTVQLNTNVFFLLRRNIYSPLLSSTSQCGVLVEVRCSFQVRGQPTLRNAATGLGSEVEISVYTPRCGGQGETSMIQRGQSFQVWISVTRVKQPVWREGRHLLSYCRVMCITPDESETTKQ